jgi:hypothetical protein
MNDWFESVAFQLQSRLRNLLSARSPVLNPEAAPAGVKGL